MSGKTDQLNPALFDFYAKPSMGQAVPLGLQHVVAAIVGVVTPAMIVAGACDLTPGERTLLIQVSLVFTALATLIQLFPIGPLGSRLPVIMGTSFAYVPTLQAIGESADLQTILGAQIVGGLVAILFGIFLKPLRKLFPPIVTGTVIFSIGLSLYATAVRYMAGGTPASLDGTFGGPTHWAVAIITLLVVIVCNNFTRGTMKLASILIGIIVGYVVSLPMGLVSFDSVGQSTWFQLVTPLQFGMPKFAFSACASMAIMFAVNSVQTIGDLTSTTMGGMDREPTDKELSGGIVAQGLSSVVGALFGGLPTASYSQNVGIVTVNKVVNRIVFVIAAGVMLVAGLIPKFSAVLTTIPQAVIGGATISVFATIAMTGIRTFSQGGITPRTVSVVGLAVALGVGVTSVPGSLGGFEAAWVADIFGSSSVVIATLVAILLNLVLPKEQKQ